MFRVGLTGGIGSGKTTVCHLFRALGVPIIDADQISREQVEPGQPALTALVTQFGSAILTPDGYLDRARLRSMVFSNPLVRRQLEAILHPLIRQRMLELAGVATTPYVILAIPLLLEAGWQPLVNRILVVDCPPETQLERTMTRDGVSRVQADAIIASQIERTSRLSQADDIIDNSGDPAQLQRQVALLHRRYLQLATAATSQ